MPAFSRCTWWLNSPEILIICSLSILRITSTKNGYKKATLLKNIGVNVNILYSKTYLFMYPFKNTSGPIQPRYSSLLQPGAFCNFSRSRKLSIRIVLHEWIIFPSPTANPTWPQSLCILFIVPSIWKKPVRLSQVSHHSKGYTCRLIQKHNRHQTFL